MNRFRQLVAGGVFAALTVAGTVPALAQEATVRGVVTDPLGARVADATIVLTGGAQPLDGKSGSDGTYSFTNVAPGLYQVVATLSGFQPFTSDQTYVGGSATRVIDITLQVTPAARDITVDVDDTGSRFVFTAPRDIEPKDWSDKLSKPFRKHAKKL